MHTSVVPFADMVLLSANTAFSVIFTEMWAICFLKEKAVWKYDIPACVLIVGGSLTIVLSANYDELTYTKERVIELLHCSYAITGYVMYAFLTLSVILVLMKMKYDLKEFRQDCIAHAKSKRARENKHKSKELSKSFSAVINSSNAVNPEKEFSLSHLLTDDNDDLEACDEEL